MILGFDIDDVVTDSSLSMIAHAKLHETEICKKGDILDHLPEVMRGCFPTPAVREYLNRYMGDIIANAQVKADAPEVLRRLKAKGHQIVYVTARGEMNYPGSTAVTEKLIAEHRLPCDGMAFDSVDKLQDCQRLHADLLVDDSVKNCTDVARGGIPTLLFTSVVNREEPTDIKRVENWLELERTIEAMVK